MDPEPQPNDHSGAPCPGNADFVRFRTDPVMG
jgi:hypothetical protein